MAGLGGAYYANEAWDHWMGGPKVAGVPHLAGGHVTTAREVLTCRVQLTRLWLHVII
jgi:hypothetical protein